MFCVNIFELDLNVKCFESRWKIRLFFWNFLFLVTRRFLFDFKMILRTIFKLTIFLKISTSQQNVKSTHICSKNLYCEVYFLLDFIWSNNEIHQIVFEFQLKNLFFSSDKCSPRSPSKLLFFLFCLWETFLHSMVRKSVMKSPKPCFCSVEISFYVNPLVIYWFIVGLFLK